MHQSHLHLRYAACSQVGFGGNFTKLIEHAVAKNDGQPATIVAHSLGCLVSLYFLTRQEPAWLAAHVDSLVAISAPWEGSVTALKGARAPVLAVVILNFILAMWTACLLSLRPGRDSSPP